MALNLEVEDDLFVLHARLEKLQFECSHRMKKLLSSHAPKSATASAVDGKGVCRLFHCQP